MSGWGVIMKKDFYKLKSPEDIVLRRVLVGHTYEVNAVEFDEKYIVSASGDKTIKVNGQSMYVY